MTPLLLALTFALAGQVGTACLPTLVLPPQQGAWVIRIETSGGFAGKGAGHLTVSSAGELFCVDIAPCPSRLIPDRQQWLSALVAGVLERKTPDATPLPSRCSDCVTTMMTLSVRTGDGERVRRYTWDVSTMKAIPDEVLRLYQATGEAVRR
jgi:hypothetical protein